MGDGWEVVSPFQGLGYFLRRTTRGFTPGCQVAPLQDWDYCGVLPSGLVVSIVWVVLSGVEVEVGAGAGKGVACESPGTRIGHNSHAVSQDYQYSPAGTYGNFCIISHDAIFQALVVAGLLRMGGWSCASAAPERRY